MSGGEKKDEGQLIRNKPQMSGDAASITQGSNFENFFKTSLNLATRFRN